MVKKDILNEFASNYDLRLVTQEAGFGKVVTGFIPKKAHMFISLDKEIAKNKPLGAYSHCDILAIEGSGVVAKQKLANWVNELNKKVEVIKVSTKGSEIQLQETGRIKFVLSLIK